jgi:Uri superfamily endonuclease
MFGAEIEDERLNEKGLIGGDDIENKLKHWHIDFLTLEFGLFKNLEL